MPNKRIYTLIVLWQKCQSIRTLFHTVRLLNLADFFLTNQVLFAVLSLPSSVCRTIFFPKYLQNVVLFSYLRNNSQNVRAFPLVPPFVYVAILTMSRDEKREILDFFFYLTAFDSVLTGFVAELELL